MDSFHHLVTWVMITFNVALNTGIDLWRLRMPIKARRRMLRQLRPLNSQLKLPLLRMKLMLHNMMRHSLLELVQRKKSFWNWAYNWYVLRYLLNDSYGWYSLLQNRRGFGRWFHPFNFGRVSTYLWAYSENCTALTGTNRKPHFDWLPM